MVFDVYKFTGTAIKDSGEDAVDTADWNNAVDSLFKVTALTSADSPYTALDTDFIITADTTGGSITINLPTAANGASKPRKHYIIMKLVAANTLTLDGNGAETINGSATKAITNISEGVYLFSDGSNWRYPLWRTT
jgi:hypothetical protein